MTDFRELLGLGPSKLEQKQASVAAKVEAKKAAIDPAEVARLDYEQLDDAGYAAKYGAAAMLRRGYQQTQARNQAAIGELPRTAGEKVADAPLSMGRSVVGMLTGTLGAALDSPAAEAIPGLGPLTTILDTAAGLSGQKKEQVRRAAADKIIESGSQFDRILAGRMSQISQVNEQIVAQNDLEDQARHRDEYAAAVAEGTPEALARAARIAKDFGTGAVNSVENPTVLANAVVGQLPMLALGPAARAGVTEQQVAARVAAAEATGATSARALLEKEARDALAERNLVGLVTAQESAGNYQQTTSQVLELNQDQLKQRYPEAAARIAAGEDWQTVRSELAHKAGTISAAITAPIAAVSSKVAAKFELDPVHGGAGVGTSLRERLTELPINLGREGLEEGLQGGGGQFAGNVGERAAGDQTVDLADGVGTAAGQGASLGIAAAGAFQSPGLSTAAAREAAAGTVELAKAGVRKLVDVAAARTVGFDEQVKAQQAEHRSRVEETSRQLSEQVRNLPEQAQGSLATPAIADPVLSPETKTELGLDAQPDLDRVSTLGRALNGYVNAKDQDQKIQMALFALRTKRELKAVENAFLDRAIDAPSDEAKAAHTQLLEHIAALNTSTPMQEIEQHLAQVSDEDLQPYFDALPSEPQTEVDALPETQRAIELVKQLAYTAPDRLPTQVVERALFQKDITPADKQQLKLALDFGKIAEKHTADLESLQTKYPKLKTSDMVRDEITEGGFQIGNKKLKSVSDYVREISRSMGDGEVNVARQHINDFHRFAVHMANKATAFDAAAKQQLDIQESNPEQGKQKIQVPFKTLDKNGRPTDAEPAFVNIAQEGGRGLIDAIFADANAVTNTYNTLIKSFPQLAKHGEVTVQAKPEWKNYTPVAQETVPNATPEAAQEVPDAPAAVQAEPKPEAAIEEQPQPARVEQRSGEDQGDHALGEAKRRTIQVGKTRLTYDVFANNVRLNNLTTPKAERGRGQAQDAMQQFIELLDDADLPSTLTVAPMSSETNEQKLQEFYSRYGYTAQEKDANGNTVMHRPRASDLQTVTKLEPTIATRFSGLREQVADSLAGANQFLKGFSLKKNSQAVFARFVNPVQDILAALRQAYRNQDQAATSALFAPQHQYLSLDLEQMQAMGELLGQAVPAVVRELNLVLQKAAHPHGKNKGFLKRLRADPAKEWSYANRKTLHVTQDTNEGEIEYQPQIAEAMALAGLHWAMNMLARPIDNADEKIDQLFPEGLPAELRERFYTAHYFEDPARDLARQIVQTMGIAPKADAPIDITDGLPKQLALDTINALHELGILELKVEALPDSNKVMTFIEFNKDATKNQWDQAQLRSLQPIRERLRAPTLLTRMLMPELQDVAHVGVAPTQIATTMQGGGQALSDNQREGLKQLQQVAYRRNVPMLEVLGKIGGVNALKLFGYQPQIPDTINLQHKRSVDGVNQGLTDAWENIADILQQQELYATANDMDANDVPVFFSHEIIANGRAMATAFGPQRNKLARELLSANHAEFALDDEKLNELFLVTAAQGLGIKTERKTHAAAAAEVTQLLSQPEYQSVLGDLLLLQQQDDVEDGFNEALLAKLQALKIDEPRKFNVLLTYAMYQQAKHDGQKTFRQSLSLELDGITDGPVNANVHFGLHRPVDEHTLLQLRQGGWIINDPNHSTMNELGANVGSNGEAVDIYGSVANRLVDGIRTALSQYRGNTLDILVEGLRALQRLGHLEENPDLKINRSLAKHPVTSMVYGSGEVAVVSKIAYDLLNHLYEEMSAASAAGEALPVETQRLMKTLMGVEIHDPAQYPNFRFQKQDFERLVQSLRGDKKEPGVGKMLVAAVRDEMDPILETFQVLYKVSALQMTALRKAFQKAYAKKHAELVAAGEILPQNGLSRNQEKEILAGLKHLSPTYKLLNAQGKHEGLDLSTRDNSGHLVLDDKEQFITSIQGNLRMPINASWFPAPGVKAASMYTIALGDATMMAQMFSNPRRATNVYDGYEASLDRIQAEAAEINQAVHTGWQFDALHAVRDSYEQMELDPDELTDDEVLQLFKELRFDPEGDPREALRALMKETWQELLLKEFQTRAMKKALGNLQSAVDHMSSGGNAFQHEGMLVADPVSFLNSRAADYFNADATAFKSTVTTAPSFAPKAEPLPQPSIQPDAELEKRLGLSSDDKLAAVPEMRQLDKFELDVLLTTYKFQDKAQQFVVDQLQRLIPENIRVFVGNPDAIARAKAREFPGVNLGSTQDVGAYYDNTLFLSVASPETLVHELVHATTLGLVLAYYRGEKGLTKTQLLAIQDLETLTREFVKLDPAQLPIQEQAAVQHVQDIVQSYLAAKDLPAAVNEYMAWSLTSPMLRNLLTNTKAPDGLVSRIVKSFLKAVRKLLGLPNNAAIESFLEATLGRYRTLTMRARTPKPSPLQPLALKPLFQSLDRGHNDVAHEGRLEHMLGLVQRTLLALPREQLTEVQTQELHNAFILANQVREQFNQAGFDFSEREQLLFELTQAMLASGTELDPVSITAFQEMYNAAINQISARDFLTDPNNANPSDAELAEADDRYRALFIDSTDSNIHKRSNLLANFVALALVHKPLYDKLAELRMPQRKLDKGNVDTLLRTATQNTFDKLSDALVHIHPQDSQQKVLNLLMERLAATQEKFVERKQPKTGREAQVTNLLKQQMSRLDGYVEELINKRLSKTELSSVDGWINGFLTLGRGALSDKGALAAGEGMLRLLNTSNLPKVVRDLFVELIGTVDSNMAVARLLTRSKHVVARVRQRLRDEGPGMVREMFSRPLPAPTWQSLHRMAQADFQALQGTYTTDQLVRLLEDPLALQTAITATEGRLKGAHQAAWLQGAEDLAAWMVHRRNPSAILARNAAALSLLAGRGVTVEAKAAQRAVPVLDRLVSLYAVREMTTTDKAVIADLLQHETQGMTHLLSLLQTLSRDELAKPDAGTQRLNAWKGYVPMSLDPRNDLVLAGPTKGAELLKRGYVLVRPYDGDPNDILSGLAYYATSQSGGQATFNQGAMQTIEGTVSGVDRLTGQSQDPTVKAYINDPRTVQSITRLKQMNLRSRYLGTRNLLPIFDADGHIEAYERVLDQDLVRKHLGDTQDLAKSIGSWMGRQAEETLARGFNTALVGVLKKTWDDAVVLNKEDEFVDISRSSERVLKDVWQSIPRETQVLLKKEFGSQVMVRKDMVHNALGYRSASFADVFTGMTDLPESTRKTVETAAFALLGKNAYKLLVTGERTWQGLVSHAKDWIVVRSGIVSLANGVANQFQLLAMGVPVTRLIPTQARKIKETEQYLRNERRLAQLRVQIASERNQTKLVELQREGKLLNDANARLSIWPLIEAGELPSIAEGLSEQDDHSLLADATHWVERKMEKLPKGLSTAARYAIIAKDTALYQGLNRMIQFGDFMAKATLYEHLMEQGKSQEEALRQVSETFVNYNLLPGRTREYFESMGLTWFLNYKIRIQKIVLRTLRENPLRFLLAGVGAELVDSDSLITSAAPNTNLSYAMGPGQFFRADDMLMWTKLYEKAF